MGSRPGPGPAPSGPVPARSIGRQVIVSGRVQGVFFRDSCSRLACSLGLRGWVRNGADGSVEAWFEGPPAAVAQLVEWCRRGPPLARVTGVVVTEGEPLGLPGFTVR